MDCWLRKVLPAAAVDNQQSIIFRTTPMNQCTIWNSTTYWPGKFLPAAAVENSNHLCKMHVDLRGEPEHTFLDYVQTLDLLTRPIYGYLDAGGHTNLVVSVVEWNTLGADNTLV